MIEKDDNETIVTQPDNRPFFEEPYSAADVAGNENPAVKDKCKEQPMDETDNKTVAFGNGDDREWRFNSDTSSFETFYKGGVFIRRKTHFVLNHDKDGPAERVRFNKHKQLNVVVKTLDEVMPSYEDRSTDDIRGMFVAVENMEHPLISDGSFTAIIDDFMLTETELLLFYSIRDDDDISSSRRVLRLTTENLKHKSSVANGRMQFIWKVYVKESDRGVPYVVEYVIWDGFYDDMGLKGSSVEHRYGAWHSFSDSLVDIEREGCARDNARTMRILNLSRTNNRR